MSEKSELALVDASLQNIVSSITTNLPEGDLEPLAYWEDGSFKIEKDSPTPRLFSLVANTVHVRRWESVIIITRQPSAPPGQGLSE